MILAGAVRVREFAKKHPARFEDLSAFPGIVGGSEALRQVLDHVRKVAPTDATVLITGESGTGKEIIARAIHKNSSRVGRSFVKLNCAAIPPSLIASELFGHEKGAFTGAIQRHTGRFEAADGGTIFLDEIGDIPPETQVALLRVLQEREFERVGSTRAVPVDVRVLAATSWDLDSSVELGAFRLDLFYRLNVFPIHVPPLRDRTDDVPLIAHHFMEQFAARNNKRIEKIDPRSIELLAAHDWPGNIRELQNVVERAVILCEGETLSIEESWLKTRKGINSEGLNKVVSSRQRELIEAALEKTQGRIAGPWGAAEKLGIPRSTSRKFEHWESTKTVSSHFNPAATKPASHSKCRSVSCLQTLESRDRKAPSRNRTA
jgi:formate hydrogenlyase transcriptional activator